MEYEYRNIDTDIALLKAAKLYWQDDTVTKQDIYDMLANQCYSKWEADRAISDYYYIYINSQNLLKYLIMMACFNTVILVICYWIQILFL
jgi:hypothetical protein